MNREKFNDHRAAHRVNVLPYETNVKFYHKGFEISLAADGQETRVYDEKDNVLVEFYDTSADSVRKAVEWIDNNLTSFKNGE